MRESEIAWAAGLFEGEGCISLMQARSKGSNRTTRWVRLAITMADRDVLEHFHAIVSVGGITRCARGTTRPAHHKDCWKWQASARRDVMSLLPEFLPWFGERRRAKAQLALRLLAELNYTRQCEYCGTEFESYNGFQRFCSKKHQEKSWQAANKEHLKAYQRQRYLRDKVA